MNSKFKFYTVIIFILPIAIIAICCSILVEHWPIKMDNLRFIDYYLAIILTFTFIWLVFGELRTKMIIIFINNQLIKARSIFGIKHFNFDDFDGFETSIHRSRNGDFEYLYLVKNNRSEIIISEFYHRNYDQMKSVIRGKVKFLGEVPFSYRRSFKEIFQ